MTDQVNNEQPSELEGIEGLEGVDLDSLSSDSSDVDSAVFDEFFGDKSEQSDEDSQSLDHDKSALGDDDDLEELLKDEEEDGDSAEVDDSTSEDSDELVEVDLDGKSYKVPSELKDHFMRQSDYTRKTQEISRMRADIDRFQEQLNEEKESFNTEMREMRTSHLDTLAEHEEFSYASQIIQVNDPDFFAEMQEKFKEALTYYNNPMVNRLSKELNEVKARATLSEDAKTINKFYAEWEQASAEIVPKLEGMGVKVDQDKVRDFWGKGISVKQAINALHGDQIQKVRESRLLKEKAKRAAQKSRKPKMQGMSKMVSTPKKFNSYQEITNHLMK